MRKMIRLLLGVFLSVLVGVEADATLLKEFIPSYSVENTSLPAGENQSHDEEFEQLTEYIGKVNIYVNLYDQNILHSIYFSSLSLSHIMETPCPPPEA